MTAAYKGQIGWKTESTWNTAVTVDKFSPFLSENMSNDGGENIPSRGHRAGRLMQHAHSRGIPIIGGPVRMEFGNTDVATLLTHLFGAVSTSGADPYTHTYTPGADPGSLTVQIGRPDTGDTVNPRTFSGVKIPSWTISCNTGAHAMLEAQLSAAAETGATALASASYTSGWAPFTYKQASITKGGSALVVDSWSISGTNNLRTDRKALNGTAVTEQITQGVRDLTLSLAMDFEDETMYDHFLDDDSLTLVCKLDNGTQSFTLTAKGYLVGSSPLVPEEGILKFNGEFVAESSTSDADALTAVLVNSESSAA